MNGRTSASGKAGVQDWVNSNFFEAPEKQSIEVRVQRTIHDLDGCEVRELGDDDTIPAEFDFLLK